MKTLDFFFIRSFLLMRRMKKTDPDAKWSAMLFSSLFVGMFFVIVLCLLGLILYPDIREFFDSPISFIAILIFSVLIIGIRYYYIVSTNSLLSWYLDMQIKYFRIRIAVHYLLICLFPIATYILFRLFVKGFV